MIDAVDPPTRRSVRGVNMGVSLRHCSIPQIECELAMITLLCHTSTRSTYMYRNYIESLYVVVFI